jgi:hypothetical protein
MLVPMIGAMLLMDVNPLSVVAAMLINALRTLVTVVKAANTPLLTVTMKTNVPKTVVMNLLVALTLLVTVMMKTHVPLISATVNMVANISILNVKITMLVQPILVIAKKVVNMIM